MITYSTLFFVYMGSGGSTAKDILFAGLDARQAKNSLKNIQKNGRTNTSFKVQAGDDVTDPCTCLKYTFNCCCAKKEPPDDANGPTGPPTAPTGYRMVRTDF